LDKKLVTVTIIAIISLVIAIIALSETYILISKTHESPIFSPTPRYSSQPSSPIPTQPTIVPTEPPSATLVIGYNESSREYIGDNTKVTLMVNVTYTSGSNININYSQFYLQLYAPRMGAFLAQGTTNALNSGSFTIGASHTSQLFELQFIYPTGTFNGMDNAATLYSLQYNGTALASWLNQGFY
jgi:hypothetical protein